MIFGTKSETLNKVFSNTVYQFIGKVVTVSFTLGITVIITRLYGRENYGYFSIMQTYPALFFIIADFGLNAIATRELAKDWLKAKDYLSNTFFIRLILSFALIGIFSLVLFLFPYSAELRFGIFLSLFMVLTQALFATTNIIFQTKLRYDLSAISLILGSVSIMASVIILTFLKAGIIWLSFSYVLGGIVTFAAATYFVKKLGVPISFSINKAVCSSLLIESLPLGLMFVFSQINFKADSILLSFMQVPKSMGLSNASSVALYSLPYKIFEVSLVVPTFFMNSVYPIFVKHMLEGKEKLKATFIKTLRGLFICGLLVSFLGVVLSPFVINILGGVQFSESIFIMKLLFLGIFIFYLTQPTAWLIVTLGKQKYLPIIYLASACFNVIGNILLIPRFSFYASAVLTWTSEILILILLTFAARKAWKEKYD